MPKLNGKPYAPKWAPQIRFARDPKTKGTLVHSGPNRHERRAMEAFYRNSKTHFEYGRGGVVSAVTGHGERKRAKRLQKRDGYLPFTSALR